MAAVFGITMPFVGVLVRYRANYTPKRLQGLTGADGDDDTDSPISYFGMMKRVHRVEGWAGLYKGIMPSIIGSLVSAVILSPLAIFFSLGHRVLPNGQVYLSLSPGIALWTLSFALSIISALLIIPVQIIINRTITTPHKLAAFAPSAALRVLLSPAERAQPLRLYLTPGVALAQVLEGLVGPAIMVLYQLIGPSLWILHRLSGLAVSLSVIAVATVLLTPLQVVATRLTLQRLGDAPDVLDAVAPPAYEEVMEFRTQEAPYTGLLDCGKQIVSEEGLRVLFRAWWLTALAMLLPVITPFVTPAA
ncbi:mitochondrial carrier domain-containing protein [Mycena galericulata]|nr:mitochondrial carrier domain-containing protein [Mycena galericulata]